MCRAREEKGKVLQGGVQERETGGRDMGKGNCGEGYGKGKLLGGGVRERETVGVVWERELGEGQGIGNLSNQGCLE